MSAPESRIIVTADVTKVSEGFARVEADATRLTGALGKISRDGFKGLEMSARQSIGALEGRIEGLASVASRVAGALAVLGGGAAFLNGLRDSINQLDALNDAADATGASIESLSALETIGRRVGTSFDTVSAILIKFNAQLEAAADPGSEAAQAFKAIGLSAEELRRLDPAEALQRTAQALSGYADNADKARLIQVQFGKSVRDAAPFLNDLAKAGDLAGTATKELTQQAETLNKNLAIFGANVEDAKRGLLSGLIPALNEAADRARDGADVFGSYWAAAYALGVGRNQYEDLNEQLTTSREKLVELREELGGVQARLSKGSLADFFFTKPLENLEVRLQARIAQEEKVLEFLSRAEARSARNPNYSNEGRNSPPPSVGRITERPTSLPSPRLTAQAPRRLSEEELGGMLAANLTRQIEANERQLAEGERVQAELEEQSQRFAEQLLDQAAQINVSLITNDRQRGEAQIELDREVLQQRLAALKQTGVNTDAAQQALNLNIIARQRALNEALKPEWKRMLDDWRNTTEAMAKSYDELMTGVTVRTEDALADLLSTGKFNIDALADYVTSAIARMVAKQAIAGITDAANLMFNGFSITPNAKGNVFTGEGVTAFADGGVVNRPTFFGYAGGRIGLMGEAGPEAVMPLTRGPDGKLGVQTHGAGQDPLVVNINAQSGVTRAELAAMLPTIREQIKAELIGSLRRPGSAL